jgi:hypothetical protein
MLRHEVEAAIRMPRGVNSLQLCSIGATYSLLRERSSAKAVSAAPELSNSAFPRWRI